MDKLLFTKCLRCRGAVIYDKFFGPHEQYWGWKCLICGEIVDPVILANRQMMRSNQEINGLRKRGAKGYGVAAPGCETSQNRRAQAK
jgi:hypothetical protein